MTQETKHRIVLTEWGSGNRSTLLYTIQTLVDGEWQSFEGHYLGNDSTGYYSMAAAESALREGLKKVKVRENPMYEVSYYDEEGRIL